MVLPSSAFKQLDHTWPATQRRRILSSPDLCRSPPFLSSTIVDKLGKCCAMSTLQNKILHSPTAGDKKYDRWLGDGDSLVCFQVYVRC